MLKYLDHAKQSATDMFKTSLKRAIQKAVEATCNLVGNRIAGKITKVSQHSQKNNSEIVTNEQGKEMHKKDIYLQ